MRALGWTANIVVDEVVDKTAKVLGIIVKDMVVKVVWQKLI